MRSLCGKVLKQAALLAVDLVFPSRCLYCASPVPYSSNCVCRSCFDSISFISGACSVCGGGIENGKCPVCSDRRFYPKRNISVTVYSGVIREIIHHFKFNRRKRLGEVLGEIATQEIRKQSVSCDMVTFVPLGPAKKHARGYNQTEIIARYVSAETGIPCVPLLAESKIRSHQKELGYGDRFYNVLGRFRAVNAEKASGKSILIIDDVFTTGATINECARVLRNAGADAIISLTIARTDINHGKI